MMERSYKKLYLDLFNMLALAVEAFDRGDVFTARRVLITAMQAAEEANLELDILPEQ